MANYTYYHLLKCQHTLPPEQRFQVARELIVARTRHMKRYLQRGKREGLGDPSEALKKMGWATDQLPKADSPKALLSLLGAASQEYYKVIHSFLSSDWGYATRKKPSPFNALLDLAYEWLEAEYKDSLEELGLDPHDGAFLAERWGQANLAKELSYPLRSTLAEQLVISVINRDSIALKDLESPTDLSEKAKGKIQKAFARRLNSKVIYRLAYDEDGEVTSYKDAISRQCELYREHCTGKAEFRALYLK